MSNAVAFPANETELNEVALISQDAVKSTIAALQAGKSEIYSSIKAVDFDARIEILDAINNAVSLGDNLEKTINLRNVIIQPVELKDEETGELAIQPRTVLIDDDGTAYYTFSPIIMRDLETIYAAMDGGPETWERPVPVKGVQQGTGNRKYYVLRVARAAKTVKAGS